MSIDLDPRAVVRPPGEPAARPPTTARPKTPEPPRMPGRRNPKWIALGIVAMCLGGLLSYAVYSQVATQTSMVVIKQTVYRGEAIEAADLAKKVIQGDPFPGAVPANELMGLVGKRATFDLPAGSVVLTSSIADTAVPQLGRAVVGLKLSTGRAPARELLIPDSPVRLVALPPSGPDAGGADQLAGKAYLARIISTKEGADGTSIEANVEVNVEQAATIAQLSAQDRLAVVRDPGK